MIQRIQTIFLLLVGVLMLVTIFLPVWEKVTPEQSVVLTPVFMVQTEGGTVIREQTTVYVAALAALAAVMAAFSIFQYNKRLLQLKLGAINSLIIAGAVVAMLLLSREGEEWIDPDTFGSYQAGLFLPIAALLSNMLAFRFIRKDEKLVRSADRFR